MPFDALRPVRPIDTAKGRPLLYLLPSTAQAEAGAEGLLAAEVAGLRARGRQVVPMLLDPGAARREPELAAEADEAARHAPPLTSALGAALRHPLGQARAARLAMAQRGLGRGVAMELGAQVAAAARRFGCAGIHAAAADASATAALIGGRMAGLDVSVAAQGGEVYADPQDLALKLEGADTVVAACPDMAEDLLALAPRAHVRVVPRGLDAEWFRREPLAPRNGRLLCMAPLVPRSGLDVLIAALRLLPAGQRPIIDVIGAGPLLETLRAEALEAEVSDQLRFLGARGRRWVAEEGPAYLGLVAPGVVAPDGDRDPAPVAVLQAMALELPVLASGLMALRQIVQPDCGHLVPPGQPRPLAHGLRWLAVMPEEQRGRLGRLGRDRVLSGFTMADRASALDRLLPAKVA
jgi:hypothetical protein